MNNDGKLYENITSKNVIALTIPTFITSDNGGNSFFFNNPTKNRNRNAAEINISAVLTIIYSVASLTFTKRRKSNKTTAKIKNSLNCTIPTFSLLL